MQSAFFEWMHYTHRRVRAVSFAIPNDGKRSAKEGYFAKLRGMTPGIPDTFMSIARGPYHGLYIEFKIHPNKPTNAQLAKIISLTQEGYMCAICYTLEEGKKTLNFYLELK